MSKQTIRVLISNDFSTLGHEATAETLDTYAERLASRMSEEFRAVVTVEAESRVDTLVLGEDFSLAQRVRERVREIESGEEWVDLAFPEDDEGEEEEDENPEPSTYVVNGYTGNWQSAITSKPELKAGDRVETPDHADAREWDDFRRWVHLCGLEMEWEDWEEDREVDVYELVARREEA